ncbi:MAG: hypothetical protein CMJ78_02140 [Planctomycetaceae bacterium]|nr:hypothetical protein [Planctomycetaceae bacterium]
MRSRTEVTLFVGLLFGWVVNSLWLTPCLAFQNPLKRAPQSRLGTLGSARPSAIQPTPVQNDANLHDVQFLGQSVGWAVGDRGVIWNTQDGGRTWSLIPAPVDCALRKVCFLTNRIGWIAGGGVSPFSRVGYGVILATEDGGVTWQRLDNGQLPQLHSVEFFGPNEGYVVGATSSQFPVGVFVTKDGGATWQEINGHHSPGWRAADFLNPDIGIIAGQRGQVFMVGGQRLLKPRVSDMGKRSLHAVKVMPGETGWLVGDGGLILKTENGGVVWQSPPNELPKPLDRVFDLLCVEARDRHVWIAGQPGSVIWHSADGGTNWQRQLTGQTLPIRAIRFQSETRGWAVGALGTMLHTNDGGTTWHVVKGQNRRLALMSIHSRLNQVSLRLLAKYAGDLGFRCMTTLVPRRDLGGDKFRWQDADLQLDQAVLEAGGAATDVGWELPIGRPGLERDRSRLERYWTQETDGQLREALVDRLVAQIRTWRPSVVVLDQPAADDATTQIINEAVNVALQIAADPTQSIHLSTRAGLEPWQVKKVFHRLTEDSVGDVHVNVHDLLPRAGVTIEVAAAKAASVLPEHYSASSNKEVYRLANSKEPAAAVGRNADFWAGLSILPGSPARRSLQVVDGADYELKQQLAKRQRNFRNYVDKFLDDKRHAGQLIAQLNDVVRGLPKDEAAIQLWRLAQNYRERGRWQLAESTLVQLVERFPDQPASQPAMRWLFQWWNSAEVVWQRTRQSGVRGKQMKPDPRAVTNNIQLQIQQAFEDKRNGQELNPNTTDEEQPKTPQLEYRDPFKTTNRTGPLKIGETQQWSDATASHWNEQALEMGKLIRKNAKPLSTTPAIQFPLASLLQKRQANNLAEGVYRGYQRGTNATPWKRAAAGELWLANPVNLSPTPIVQCQRTMRRPHLDGLLSDDCWQDAKEIPLRADGQESLPGDAAAFALICYDSQYLYFGASVPRVTGVPDDRPFYEGRQHDANLSDFDRVSLYLDIDRDYTTFYSLHFDQRGWAAEKCWEDASWNPKMFIAADGDDSTWRIEVAIPLTELAPMAPGMSEAWAMGITRTTPGQDIQSWTQPASQTPRPETFGLLQFSRPSTRNRVSQRN